MKRLLIGHIRELHGFYGQGKGFRLLVSTCPGISRTRPNDQFRRTFNAIEDASEQLEALEAYFENLSVKKS